MTLEGNAALAARAARGDSKAFRALLDATSGVVYRVALRTVGDSADAEDVVQETYVRAWQRLPTLKDHGAIVGWLCRIASNIATDKLRARKSRPQVLASDDDARVAVERLTNDTPGAESLINSREVSAVVRAAVMDIDERYRVAMLLKDVDGLSAAEIAAALDIPVGTVESRASRGRDQLKQRLTKLVRSGKLP